MDKKTWAQEQGCTKLILILNLTLGLLSKSLLVVTTGKKHAYHTHMYAPGKQKEKRKF